VLHGYLDGSRPILIRTDHSDDIAWRDLLRRLEVAPDETAEVVTLEPLETTACDGWTLEDFRRARTRYNRTDASRVYLADNVAMTHPERPVLVMWQSDDWPWDTCRVLPSGVGEIDLRLQSGALSVAELVAAADDDGVYRGPIGVGATVAVRVYGRTPYRLGSRLLYRRITQPFTGDDVLELQSRLVELGYDLGKRDGRFGAQTEAALRGFQRRHALLDDGSCGPLTLKALSDNDGS
jgi:hypothetical protein